MAFLEDVDLRQLAIAGLPSTMTPLGLALGRGDSALEIAVLESSVEPRAADVAAAWKTRWAGRAAPVLVAIQHGDRLALCGPSDPNPPVHLDVERAQAEQICRAALSEPDRHRARTFLAAALRTLETPLPGLRNEGLFATHHLQNNVPSRPDFAAATARGVEALALRDEPLIRALGFVVERTPSHCVVLRKGDSKVALAVLVNRGTDVDAPSETFNGLSPVSYGLAKADQENLPYLLVLEGPAVRLYVTNPGRGAGRRGRTETFLEARLDLMNRSTAGYLALLFSADALARGGSTDQILAESYNYAAELGGRLRERIYEEVVPRLAEGVAAAMQLHSPDPQELRETYGISLTILFRLLFIAYAEDRLLLPYQSNERYRVRSLKAKARDLADRAPEPFDDQPTLWGEVTSLFSAVDQGKKDWGVPAYGGMFSSDVDISSHGAAIARLALPDAVMGPVLTGLLVDESPEGRGPVDFRSLGVREFGTIYEGLLESDLAVAEQPLAVDADGAYRPAKRGEKAVVREGAVYLHNASGARRSTGSYFTKPFVVDHLLDTSLEPALQEHAARLDALTDDAEAAAAFFDFRVVDLAVGSGHFLVAAVDRVERALFAYLSRRKLPKVADELARLRAAASAAAGSALEIEDGQLLRRQIARRCIYGIDMNPMAIELARLSIWIHTFVPGLPLSFLDHALVRGNSLIGVATIDEAAVALGGDALFGQGVRKLLAAGRADLEKLGRLADADRAEIKQAREAAAKAREKAAPLAAVFDYVVASRIAPDLRVDLHDADPEILLKTILAPRLQKEVQRVLAAVERLHFPIAFAEVFLRERGGFDVVLGNPPWEEVTLERDRYFGRHIPGLQGMAQKDREKLIGKIRRDREDLERDYQRELTQTDALRKVLLTAGYPGMGTGDPDLYKAFVWRFWHLAAKEGHIGVVLPRSVFQAKGSTEFRQELFTKGEFADLTFLLNNKQWVFEDVHPQYTIALTSLRKVASPSDKVPLRGPYVSRASFAARKPEDAAVFTKADVLSWTDTAALPMLPTQDSVPVFVQLRKAPRLDFNRHPDWRVRPYAELHATKDKQNGIIDVMSVACPRGFWPVFKGETFDIWESDTGAYYGYANPKVALPELQRRRKDGFGRSNSPFFEFKREATQGKFDTERSLPCMFPRIAFRDVTRATDSRTVRVALVPPKIFLANTAPFLLVPRGDERDQAFLLGVMSSRTLDWYARRFVEIHLNYNVLNPLPVPRPPRSSRLWQRAVELAGRLGCVHNEYKAFAAAVGVECGPLAPDEKADMIAELEAVVAHLYGLTAAQVRHIYETFHEGWDYTAELEAVLVQFDAWARRGQAA